MALLEFSLFALLACSAQAQDSSEVPKDSMPLQPERVFTTQYTGIEQPRRLVIRTPQQWQEIWREIRRDQSPLTAPPAVDFSQSIIILAAMGMRETGGYTICIDGVYRNGGRLFVVVRQVAPQPESLTAQVLTSPVVTVQVPRSDEPVIFVERQEIGTQCE